MPDAIIRASWAGTAALTVTAVPAAIAPDTFQTVSMTVAIGLFVAGVAVFFAAYAIAIGRSREVLIGMGGLFFLSGCAPPRVQRHLMLSFGTEVIVAIATASIGMVTVPSNLVNPLAFGLLAPMYGLGLAGLWGARHGTFPPRSDPSATD